MIPAGVQVFVALEPVDMRFGFERLAGLVRERIGYEPRSGALFVFVGKRRATTRSCSATAAGCAFFTSGLIAERSFCPTRRKKVQRTSRSTT